MQSDSHHSVEDWGSTMKTLCLPVLLLAIAVLRSESHPSHGRHKKTHENLKKGLQGAGIANLTIHHEKVTDGSFLLTLRQHYHTSRSRLTSFQKQLYLHFYQTITSIHAIRLFSVIMDAICKCTEMLNSFFHINTHKGKILAPQSIAIVRKELKIIINPSGKAHLI